MTSLDFAEAARRLGEATRRAGFAAPGFRSPPRDPNRRRSIRWRRNGDAVVAVRVKGRPPAAVVADMIDGVIATNTRAGRQHHHIEQLRDQLWAAVADLVVVAPEPTNAEIRSIRAA